VATAVKGGVNYVLQHRRVALAALKVITGEH